MLAWQVRDKHVLVVGGGDVSIFVLSILYHVYSLPSQHLN
jgi:hypothetical protein